MWIDPANFTDGSFWLTLLLAYLLGAVPFGLILTRLAGLGDIRQQGSGNIGATNVLRTGGKKLAIATLLLDMGKGWLAVYLAMHYAPQLAAWVGLCAFIGHIFPIWLKFKGGKGVATALGVILAFDPMLGACVAGCWLLVASLSRLSSLSALVAFAQAPLYAAWLAPFYAPVIGLMVLLIWLRHHGNIARLVAGTEPRFGLKND